MPSSSPDPSGAWQLSAELKQGTTDPPPPADSDVVAPPAWLDAAESVRATVKWLVAAFAAVGAVMFTKGFVTTPALSWEDNTGQLLGAWLAGIVGVLGVGWLIHQAMGMIRPRVFELGDLPDEYIAKVDAEPRFHLPSGAGTFKEFKTTLRNLRTSEATHRVTVKEFESEVIEATSDRDAVQARCAAAEATLNEARREHPLDPGKITAAEQTLTAEQTRLRKTERKLDHIKDRLASERASHDSLVAQLAVYNRTRKNLLDRAGYWQASRGLDASGFKIFMAALVAAAGGIGYQLLLATPKDADASPAPAARVGELVRTNTPAGQELWKALNLAPCQADSTAKIAVAISGGKGTQADPYVVSTLPTARCAARTFTVVNEVALVSVPTKTVITYEPAASPTSSG
ncbi:hypothetical protein [Luteipulveratus mongoliensis]|uniref:Uncharacterized protein n=1 Tax=Luteipulveratus mongoliensis TaxID=571913 RepID=A0A0K1JJN2_9MICO|nr:hypothetical protein [Luteipulveratus mongoliensis]AKU16916.1 hypothetical protein VV02_15350 [Luteipulveratus mongoliensis]